MSRDFRFKRFSVTQNQSAFKVGTDSVLLGSWLPNLEASDVLDIGSGTGILSLMMAQRFQNARITAIEVDRPSFIESANNFTQSPWLDRIKLENRDIIDWSIQNRALKFDLIITNPPYFINSLTNENSIKSLSRHQSSLNLDSLCQLLVRHLSAKGSFATILPCPEFGILENKLAISKLFPRQICWVSSFEDSKPIRKMGVFSFGETLVNSENHFIYNKDKTRSIWYKKISSDFYL